MKQSEKLTKLANEVQKDIELVRENKMNLEQAKSIALLANAVIKANLAAIKMNQETKQ